MVIAGKYAGQKSVVESNMSQWTMDYPEAFANGHRVRLDTKGLVTVRWEEVEGMTFPG